jgi:hypothetical protein
MRSCQLNPPTTKRSDLCFDDTILDQSLITQRNVPVMSSPDETLAGGGAGPCITTAKMARGGRRGRAEETMSTEGKR